MEFSLPFMTFDLFGYTSSQSGRLLGYMGLIASILQASITRRLHPLRVVQLGVVACAGAFFALGRLNTQTGLWGAATLLAITTATVVTGLNSLSSFEATEGERGGKLGNHRSWGKSLSQYKNPEICRLTPYRPGGTDLWSLTFLYFVLVGRKGRCLRHRRLWYARSLCTCLWRAKSSTKIYIEGLM